MQIKHDIKSKWEIPITFAVAGIDARVIDIHRYLLAVYEQVKHANGKQGTETKTITKIAKKRNVENL